MVHYTFDACSPTAAEAQGTGLDATLMGDATCGEEGSLSDALGGAWSSGTALVLDGSGDYAEVADDDRLEPAALTLSAWFWRDEADETTASIVSKGNSDTSSDGYWLSALGLMLCNQGLETELSAEGDARDRWHHVVATYDGDLAQLYLDGAEAARQSVPHGIGYGDEALLLGAMTGRIGRYDHMGLIGEVALWERAMTREEVAELHDWYGLQ